MDQDAHGLLVAGLGATLLGRARVDEACAKALELDVVDANLIARMLERALESRPVTEPAPSAQVIPLRFARAAEEFRPSGGDGRTP